MAKIAAKRLRWTKRASQQLLDAWLHVAAENPHAADQMAERILTAARELALHSLIGRPGRRNGTRERVVSHTPYLLIYRARAHSVQILRVLHHSRKYP